MRRKFGKLIAELAKKDDKIVLIVGDIGYGIFDEFREQHPKKFFNLSSNKKEFTDLIEDTIWEEIQRKE